MGNYSATNSAYIGGSNQREEQSKLVITEGHLHRRADHAPGPILQTRNTWQMGCRQDKKREWNGIPPWASQSPPCSTTLDMGCSMQIVALHLLNLAFFTCSRPYKIHTNSKHFKLQWGFCSPKWPAISGNGCLHVCTSYLPIIPSTQHNLMWYHSTSGRQRRSQASIIMPSFHAN